MPSLQPWVRSLSDLSCITAPDPWRILFWALKCIILFIPHFKQHQSSFWSNHTSLSSPLQTCTGSTTPRLTQTSASCFVLSHFGLVLVQTHLGLILVMSHWDLVLSRLGLILVFSSAGVDDLNRWNSRSVKISGVWRVTPPHRVTFLIRAPGSGPGSSLAEVLLRPSDAEDLPRLLPAALQRTVRARCRLVRCSHCYESAASGASRSAASPGPSPGQERSGVHMQIPSQGPCDCSLTFRGHQPQLYYWLHRIHNPATSATCN